MKTVVMNAIFIKEEVLPRFELGSLDSESKVLTITPLDQLQLNSCTLKLIIQNYSNEFNFHQRRGLTEISTQIAGFKVQSANHYTIRPVTIELFHSETNKSKL